MITYDRMIQIICIAGCKINQVGNSLTVTKNEIDVAFKDYVKCPLHLNILNSLPDKRERNVQDYFIAFQVLEGKKSKSDAISSVNKVLKFYFKDLSNFMLKNDYPIRLGCSFEGLGFDKNSYDEYNVDKIKADLKKIICASICLNEEDKLADYAKKIGILDDSDLNLDKSAAVTVLEDTLQQGVYNELLESIPIESFDQILRNLDNVVMACILRECARKGKPFILKGGQNGQTEN